MENIMVALLDTLRPATALDRQDNRLRYVAVMLAGGNRATTGTEAYFASHVMCTPVGFPEV